MTDTTAVATPAKKPARKPAKKAAKAKKAASAPRGDSVRVRALKAISKKADGLTAAETQAAIGLEHGLKPTLDQEIERGHLLHAAHPQDKDVATYKISAKGKKALAEGTVDPKRGAAAK